LITISPRKKKSKMNMRIINVKLLPISSGKAILIGVKKQDEIMHIAFKISHIYLNSSSG
jgi:hypothetical protein